MKKLTIILTLFLICAISFAQTRTGTVKGRLIGQQSKSALDYAAVVLKDADTHSIINGTITDSLGLFSIDGIKHGTYELLCSYVGCTDYVTPSFSIDADTMLVNFSDILLDDSGLRLKETVVTGHRSTYIQSIDKKIFNVGSDIASASGAVSDLLQNVPSVQVDIEGNVSLRGNDNVQVLINGKPSVLMRSANRGTVLQQLPASSIERIEVITNPSAQFKPDGTSGIINLIIKKERTEGFSGSLVGNMGNTGRHNAGVSLGWNSPVFGVTANYGYRVDRRDRKTSTDRTLIDSLGNSTYVAQVNDSRAKSKSHIGGLGIQWNPTKKDAFEASGSYTYMSFPRYEANSTTQGDGNQITRQFVRHRNDTEYQREAEGSAAYVHTFSEGHTLSLDYTFAWQGEVENNAYINNYSIPVISETKDSTIISQKNRENLIRLVYSGEIDDKNSLVIGYEAELDRSNLSYYANDLIEGSWVKNTDRSNDFLFNENVHSLYSTWEHSFDRFAFMAGVRTEQSFITSNLVTTNKIVKDNYFMVYPTLHTSYTLNDNAQLQFNYSLRVNRPEGDDLNPFPEYQDLYNLKAGNPYLRPEKIHSLEVGWQYKHNNTTLILTPYYRYTFNKITEITKVLDSGVLMTTKENMSSSSAAGMEAVLNSRIGRWCTYNMSANLFYNTIDASDLGYSSTKSAFAWYVSLNADFMPFKNMMIQVNTRYRSSQLTPQGKSLGTYIMNMGAKYDIPQWNIALTATVSDLFDSYKNVTIIDTPSIKQTMERRRAPRIFYLGINYTFGNNGTKHSSGDKLKYDESL